MDASGRTVTRTTSFRTLAPTRTFSTHLEEGHDQTFGVGMPVILTFSHPIKNRAVVERSLQLRTSRPVIGAWYWDGNETLYFRPQNYWPAHTTVTLDAHLNGVEGAPGVYDRRDLTQTFRIGRSLIVTASTITHRMHVYRNGHLRYTWPISTGRPGDDTPDGTYLTIDKGNPVLMTGPGYSLEVPWAVRFTWTGDFLHDAYWSVGEQGLVNVSHGCVNMAPANAETYYQIENPGDPVTITGSPRPASGITAGRCGSCPGRNWSGAVPWAWRCRPARTAAASSARLRFPRPRPLSQCRGLSHIVPQPGESAESPRDTAAQVTAFPPAATLLKVATADTLALTGTAGSGGVLLRFSVSTTRGIWCG